MNERDDDPVIEYFTHERPHWRSTDSAVQLRPVVSAAVALAPGDDYRGRRLWKAYPQRIFRGDGLWLWGADETTRIHDVRVGSKSMLGMSDSPLPALFFEAGMSFAEFEALLATPRESWKHEALKRLPVVPAHQKLRMNTAELGMHLLLDVEGPLLHAVLWGRSID